MLQDFITGSNAISGSFLLVYLMLCPFYSVGLPDGRRPTYNEFRFIPPPPHMAQQPPVGQGPLIIEASPRLHDNTQTHRTW
jgi:hypothetical protein